MLITYLQQAVANAPKNLLIQDVGIFGFTSDKIRGLLNNLVSGDFVSYLEVGTWQGATFVSALYNNKPKYALGIDNFSEFEGKQQFYENCKRYLECDYTFLEKDAFSVDLSIIPSPINVYFYDGCHDEESHYKALEYYIGSLADNFIFLVDDWNWDRVKKGTKRAIQDLKLHVEYEIELPARYNADKEQWWNGVYAAVIKK